MDRTNIDVATLRSALEELDRATAEIARLTYADDRGSGERTARLASLGAWEMRRNAMHEAVTGLWGSPDVDAARVWLAQAEPNR